MMSDAVLHFVLSFVGNRVGHRSVHRGLVFGMNALHPGVVFSVEAAGRSIVQRGNFVGPIERAALQVPLPGANADAVLRQMHAFFAALQCLLGQGLLAHLLLRLAVKADVFDGDRSQVRQLHQDGFIILGEISADFF